MTRHKTTVPSLPLMAVMSEQPRAAALAVAATATPRDPFALLQEVNDVLPPYQLVQL